MVYFQDILEGVLAETDDGYAFTYNAEQTINERVAVTGFQPKPSVMFDKTKGHSRLLIEALIGEYILKLQHPDFEEVP